MTRTDDGVRVGFVGAGWIARFHANVLKAAERPFRFGPVHDADPERAERFARHTGATVVADLDEVVADSDAVYVCTWTSAHARVVAEVCAAGLPVFCEKPLGVDLAGATAVTGSVRGAGVVNQVGLVLRFSPAFALLADLVADRATHGRLMTVTLRDDQHLPTQGRYASTWRGDRARAGSGVLLEHSIHDVDLLERLAGPMRSVSAHQRFFHGLDGIEDLVVATFEHSTATGDPGPVTTLTTAWHDHLDRPGNRYLEVVCERAHGAVTGDWSGPVTWHHGETTDVFAGDDLVAECRRRGVEPANPAAAFLDAVAGRAVDPPAGRPTVDDAHRAHVVVDAAYRSAAAGAAPTAVA